MSPDPSYTESVSSTIIFVPKCRGIAAEKLKESLVSKNARTIRRDLLCFFRLIYVNVGCGLIA